MLIVDDSTLFRKVLKDSLSPLTGIVVEGMVANGRDALLRAASLRPDIITLDVEMPGMNGLEVLSALQEMNFAGAVIMISTHTKKGAPLTVKALELGAFDFIMKPSFASIGENMAALREMFLPMAQAHAQRKKINNLLERVNSFKGNESLGSQNLVSVSAKLSANEFELKIAPQILAIGVSTGGPRALNKIIPEFSANFKIPVVIVQHMPKEFTAEFARNLNGKSSLTVKEAEDGEALCSGTVYIAPGGRQLKIVQAGSGKIIQITDDQPENNCKPSVDYCFRSLAKLYGNKAIGVILTGMGRDGAVGVQLMKGAGARIIAQDEKTSVVFGMPRAAIDTGGVDVICSLNDMVKEINRHL